MKNDHFDVVVIGAGPVGLVVANLLGKYGIKTLIVEKTDLPYSYPRAVGIDDETLRTFQTLGLSQAQITSMCTGVKVEYFSTHEYCYFLPDTPVTPFYGYPLFSSFIQPKLETALRDKLKNYKNVIFKVSCTFIKYETETDEIVVELEKDQQLFNVSCKFLLGCDGGASRVREQMHFGLEGVTQLERWLVVDMNDSKEIRANIDSYKLEASRERPFLTINLPDELRRVEIRLDKMEFAKGDLDEATVRQVLHPLLKNTETKIIRSRVYERHYRVADHFSQDNIFVLGDAAHLVPPYGGQGMCSGVKDALNLAWKLAFILKHNGNKKLLKTYENERIANIKAIHTFVKTLSSKVEDSFINTESGKRISTDFYRQLKPLTDYRNGCALSTKYAGELLPQPRVSSAELKDVLLDDFLGGNFAIIGINHSPLKTLSKEALSFWEKLGAKFIYLNTKTENLSETTEVTLSLAKAAGIFNDPDIDFLIIRPDHIVLAASKSAALDAITKQAKTLLTQINESNVMSSSNQY